MLEGEVIFMSVQMTTIEVDRNTAAILQTLKAKADAQGTTLDALLKPLAEGENGTHQPERQMTPKERAADLVQWLKDHSVKGVVADDSRESIYTREDEAL
jgi:hypothetical protein